MSDPPQRPSTRASRRVPNLVPVVPALETEDRFFRHIVSSMRNGVIAVRRDGTLMLMNAEAYRIFSLTPDPADVGRPFADVLKTRGDIVRVLTAAFELSHLPNRAETRLRDLDRVVPARVHGLRFRAQPEKCLRSDTKRPPSLALRG